MNSSLPLANVNGFAFLSPAIEALGWTLLHFVWQGTVLALALGCFLALDAASCAVAAVVFLGVLFVTRYVSLASLFGGLAFAVAHLVRDPDPLARGHVALSALALVVLVLLVVRHRKNLARIWAGTAVQHFPDAADGPALRQGHSGSDSPHPRQA